MTDFATSASPPATPSLRHKTVHGVVWLMVQNLATRGVTLVQQILLAWFLAKNDFGLIALAYTVSSFVNLLANPGIDTVLVQRQRRFQQWATPAFWLGMTTGLLGMTVMAVAAPVAAWVYGRPTLVGLILVMAIAAPFQTLQIVPRAKLQSQLRFRAVVSLNFFGNVVTAVLTVLLAYLGFGAYSLAIPVPIVAAAVAAVAWRLARPTVHRHPHFRRWKYLLGDSTAMGGTQLMQTLVNQGDYLCLGLAGVSDSSIGVYYFAYRFSTQSFSLIANTVPAVLFPSLSQLGHDPDLQVRSTMRASRLIALVTIPFCLLQILLAGPVIRLTCPPRWFDAILLLQILTVGIMVNAPCWPAASLMMAQRRFRELLLVSICYGVVFFAMIVGALMIQQSIVAVALAVALWYYWSSPYAYWAAIRPALPWYNYYFEIYRPFLAGALSFIPSALLMNQFPQGRIADGLSVLTVTTAFCLLFVVLVRWLAPGDFNDFLKQLSPRFELLAKKVGRNSLNNQSETVA